MWLQGEVVKKTKILQIFFDVYENVENLIFQPFRYHTYINQVYKTFNMTDGIFLEG